MHSFHAVVYLTVIFPVSVLVFMDLGHVKAVMMMNNQQLCDAVAHQDRVLLLFLLWFGSSSLANNEMCCFREMLMNLFEGLKIQAAAMT